MLTAGSPTTLGASSSWSAGCLAARANRPFSLARHLSKGPNGASPSSNAVHAIDRENSQRSSRSMRLCFVRPLSVSRARHLYSCWRRRDSHRRPLTIYMRSAVPLTRQPCTEAAPAAGIDVCGWSIRRNGATGSRSPGPYVSWRTVEAPGGRKNYILSIFHLLELSLIHI